MNKKNKQDRFVTRKKYIYALFIFFGAWILILFSPLYLHKKIQRVDQVLTQSFIESRNLNIVDRYKNKDDVVVEFAVDDEDGAITKDLANLNYKYEVKTAKGDYQSIKGSFKKITDSFFVLKLTEVPETYELMKITVNTVPINKDIDTQTQQDMIYYLHQDKIKTVTNTTDFNKDALYFETKNLKKEIETQNKEIAKYKASINLNEELINKLSDDMDYQTEDEKVDSRVTIDNYKVENETSNEQVKAAKEKISDLKKKIDLKHKQVTNKE